MAPTESTRGARPARASDASAKAEGIYRSRLADQVYELLKDRILDRKLVPGQRLSVPAIAKELDLSRSPVREAVQRLVQERLATEQPHQGAVVATADLKSLVDLYQVRAALDGLSAELAVGARDTALATDLAAIQDDHRRAYDRGSNSEVIRADTRFHARIMDAAANPELLRVLQPILHRMSLAMLAGDQSWPARALDEHQAVIDAIADRDAAGAHAAMVAHVLRVREDLLTKLRTAGNPE